MNPVDAQRQGRFIGLISGTSMDAVDAALVQLGPGHIELLAHHSHAIPAALRADLVALCQPRGAGDRDAIDLLGATDRHLGELFAAAALELLRQSGVTAADVTAIGSHGQTVRHRPPNGATRYPFSLQIGDPNVIAARTGITTVADFRRRDLAVGGQGAPLVPAFHRAAFADSGRQRALINVGGIANLTVLGGESDLQGFDIGPGNCLLDGWIQRHRGLPYDDRGCWSAAHAADANLLKQLLAHPFFALPPPKSTGREDFHLAWLDKLLAAHPPLDPGRVQATLLALTGQTIAAAVRAYAPTATEVYLCGGGAHNDALRAYVARELGSLPVATTAALGLAPDWVEAAAFAWLARQTLLREPGNLPTATGATQPTVLGAIYPG